MKKYFAKLKARWIRFLEKIAEENKKEYGQGGLHCCSLHKQYPHHHK